MQHDHADATLGLDDVRCIQPRAYDNEKGSVATSGAAASLPVFVSPKTLDTLKQKFDYLMGGHMDNQTVKGSYGLGSLWFRVLMV